jgi:DNA repair protein RadD
MKLRDYQIASVASIFEYFENNTGNPIVAMPTGTGKSVVIADFIRQALMSYPGTRVMKLTHVKELISQNLNKLLAVWPTAPAGVYSAGLKRKESIYPITFGGVGTVARATADHFGRIDLLLIDECHLLSPNDTTMYQRVIQGLKDINPYLKVIGFTATPYRLGHGMLTDQGGIFTDLCFDLTTLESFNWLLEQGYLSRLVPKRTVAELDISAVHMHGGEYKLNELQDAVDRDEVTYAAIQEMLAVGHDRNHWLIFASGIEHAVHVAAMLDSMGVAATCVHSKMSDDLRDNNLRMFTQGKCRAMVNNGILTTGFDYPEIDLIGMLRPTQSPSLWVQMLGRGTRPVYAPGFDLETTDGRLAAIAAGPKPDCLVLDFAGNTKRLGPINDPVLPRKKGKGGGTAPIKVCELCETYNHASVRFCAHCGAEFPKEVKIAHHASTEELIADNAPKTEVFKVDRVVYHKHQKDGSPDSIKVSYFCGLRMFKEYLCLEHAGYAGKRARDWWRDRALDEPPETVAEALESLDVLRQPSHIRVWLKPKYDEIIACCYNGEFANG